MIRPWAALLLAGALAGCDDMADQPRYDEAERAALFDDGKVLQLAPPGTVARDDLARAQELATRPALSAGLLARGRDRYAIFCVPCHGPAGYGTGTVPARGFPRPPSFHDPARAAMTARHVVDVITHGHGVMYSYADRVPPGDRWAIAAYIQALQLSQNVPAGELPDGLRRQLEAQ